MLSVIVAVGLAACGSALKAPAEEAPLQPAAVCPSSFDYPNNSQEQKRP